MDIKKFESELLESTFFPKDKNDNTLNISIKTRYKYLSSMLEELLGMVNNFAEENYSILSERETLYRLTNKSNSIIFLLYILKREGILNEDMFQKHYLHFRNYLHK